MTDYLRKNEISKILGMTKSTVRFYEQEGLISPNIDDNNYRRYTIEELKKLSQINFMRSLEFDLDTIRTLMSGEMNDLEDVLKMQKDHLEALILDLQSKSKHLDMIIEITHSKLKHMSYEIKSFSKRRFYKLNSKDHTLSGLLQSNTEFFKASHLEIGSWFVNVAKIDCLIPDAPMEFEVYVEVSQSDQSKVEFSNEIFDFDIFEAGDYLSVSLVLDEEKQLDWEEIKMAIASIISNEKLSIRGSRMLFVNNDNMNFNFSDVKRIITVQIPVE